MPCKLLCIGDMHLGRRPNVPQDLFALAGSLTEETLTPVEAWTRATQLALDEQVDAVVLLGDLIDGDGFFYPTFGPLKREVERLTEAQIHVAGIAGNHDTKVLPRLAKEVPTFRLLGRGGAWEDWDIPGTDVTLVGWSFPAEHYDKSPLESFDSERLGLQRGRVNVGLLHCDITNGTSSYAPVRRDTLSDPIMAAWLLGHIHVPGIPAGDARPVGYLGSLMGLDPTETGDHGPWLLTVDNRRVEMKQMPLGPLRWERFDVDLSALASADDVDGHLNRALDQRFAAHAVGLPLAIGCRIRLTGRTRHREALLNRLAGGGGVTSMAVPIGGTAAAFIDAVDPTALRPAYELDRMARAEPATAPVILAGLLAQVQQAGPLRAQALSAVRDGIMDPLYRAAGLADPSEEALEAAMLDAGYRALDALRAQNPEAFAELERAASAAAAEGGA